MDSLLVSTTDDRGVLTLTLNRPDRRNAFESQMIRQVTEAFATASADSRIRVVVLAGNGPAFCAGGDICWMRECGKAAKPERVAHARSIAGMFDTIDRCGKPTVALVQGAALGGGTGFVAACDYVLATKDAIFGTTEVSLGIVAACLAPLLLAKVGASQARRFLLSGARISAQEAYRIGLVHSLVAGPQSLPAAAEEVVGQFLSGSPTARCAAKAWLHRMTHTREESSDILDAAALVLAESWAAPAGQQGMTAFIEKS